MTRIKKRQKKKNSKKAAEKYWKELEKDMEGFMSGFYSTPLRRSTLEDALRYIAETNEETTKKKERQEVR